MQWLQNWTGKREINIYNKYNISLFNVKNVFLGTQRDSVIIIVIIRILKGPL